MAAPVPVAPEVGAAAVALAAGVLELDTHSSSEADPSKSSPPPVSVAPMVLPFLCSDNSESDTEIPERHVSPTPHDVMLTRWRSRVTSRSSSPTTSTPEIPTAPILPAPSAIVAPSSEFPLAPVVAPLRIRRRRAILIRHGEDIPIGRLYRTHPGGPYRALTTRKSVRPLPSHCLALRYTSHHLDCFTSGSSSSLSSSDHSSSGHSISGHSLPVHSPPDTTVADSSTPPRFVYPPLARTLWCSEAYRYWRSPAATVTSSIHVVRALVPSRPDLLPPRKRFRDSISPEDCVEENIHTDVLEDIEADAMADEVAVDRDVEARVNAGIGMEVDVGVNVEDEVKSSNRGTMEVGVDVVSGINILDGMLMLDVVEHLEQVDEGLQDIYDHVIEIPLQRIEDIKMGQRELEARSLIDGGERDSLLEQVASLERINARLQGTMMMERARADRRLETFANMTITRSGITLEAIEELVNQRVEEALAAYEATRAVNALEAKSQSQNSSDGDNGNGGNGNGGEGNGGDRNGGNGNPNENNRGTEGVVRLIRWFEKMETMFHISNCPEKYQVKYATCTLLNSALTWWNSHKRTVGTEAVFAMSWRELMKLMAEVYCPRNEIQKMEFEL
ncbi:hypothetical protein Tco_0271568 [Tanacetum coccineum]